MTNAKRRLVSVLAVSGGMLLALAAVSCNANLGTIQSEDICKCLPVEPDIADYRHAAKHVPIPDNITPQEIDVTTILNTWAPGDIRPPDAPRTGRELNQVFHIGRAFLQNASVNNADCDVHIEISQTADKGAPRVVVETPVDSEFCSARKNIQSQLASKGFRLDSLHGGEIPTAIPAEIKGLAFEDFEHGRGSAQVATTWELHPAVVKVVP